MTDDSYNPYLAAIVDKDEANQQQFFQRFYALAQPVKDVIAAPQTTARIKALFTSGIAPAGYEVAISKIVMFVALGDVPAGKVTELLTKLNIPEPQAKAIGQALSPIVQDIEKARTKPVSAPTPVPETLKAPPTSLPEMPPMTRPTESGPKPLSPQIQGRNIIDLRKKN